MTNHELFTELKSVFLSSFTGNLCKYRDYVIADRKDVSTLFAGQDCYASNKQKDIEYPYNASKLLDLANYAKSISIYYHDRSNGDLEYEVHYSKENGKWKCHTKYYDDYQDMLG